VDQDQWKDDRKQQCQHRSIPLPNLRAVRRSRALSQRQLAELAGVSANTVRSLESGRRGAYPVTVRRLASALEVSPVDLVREPRPGREELEGK
jgi:transcriptional regulator with XRE-family HTH domain